MSRTVRTLFIALVVGLFALSAFAGAIAAQQAADPAVPPPTASSQFAILVTTIAGFASLLATHLFQFYRENRNRKWDLADRALAREELRKSVEDQRIETIETAKVLAQVSNINREHLLGAIATNTKLTSEAANKADAAYVAANNFNAKIEKLHQELHSLRQQQQNTENTADPKVS